MLTVGAPSTELQHPCATRPSQCRMQALMQTASQGVLGGEQEDRQPRHDSNMDTAHDASHELVSGVLKHLTLFPRIWVAPLRRSLACASLTCGHPSPAKPKMRRSDGS
eukprot:2504583-Amphidinium_carterae.1